MAPAIFIGCPILGYLMMTLSFEPTNQNNMDSMASYKSRNKPYANIFSDPPRAGFCLGKRVV